MNSTAVYPEIRLDGVPLWLLILMSSLSLLGIIYAVCIIIFNLSKAKNKVIKMTSPNINVLILVGAICGYLCMVILGLDSGHVGQEAMEALHQSSTFILTIGSTLIYGSMFVKSWRVFLVFRNINFNGKLTRDEHLLVGVLVMVLIDLAILLPWQFADPIRCTRRVVQLTSNVDTGVEIQYEVDDCQSSLQALWVSLIYFYKLLLILAGLYFTWQTRHVTLPSLKDSTSIYLVVFTLVTMAIVALPTIVMAEVGMKMRYTNGVLILWTVLTVTISLLFVPKIILEHKSREAAGNVSAFNFLFSESMRKTQEAVRKCSLCFCCSAEESDRYAQEMLASEIDTLKRTIKQKDDTIRELNDRLYIGTEKFHEYLINPKSNRSALKILQDRYEAKKSKSNGVIVRDQPTHDHMPRTDGLDNPPPQTMYDYHEERYEDEGVHSSDSYIPNNYHHLPPNNNNNSVQQQDTYYPPIQEQNLPVRTVSNGYISHSLPRRERLASGSPHHHSHHNHLGSLHSLHSVNGKQHHPNMSRDWRSPSPNHDSAYDDHTPSSDGHGDKYLAEQQQPNLQHPQHPHHQQHQQEYVSNLPSEFIHHQHPSPPQTAGIAQTRQFSQIDLGAMEYDALKHFQRNPSLDNRSSSVRPEASHQYGSRTAVSQI